MTPTSASTARRVPSPSWMRISSRPGRCTAETPSAIRWIEPPLSCIPRPSSCPAGRMHSTTALPSRRSLLPRSDDSLGLLRQLPTGDRRSIRPQEAPIFPPAASCRSATSGSGSSTPPRATTIIFVSATSRTETCAMRYSMDDGERSVSSSSSFSHRYLATSTNERSGYARCWTVTLSSGEHGGYSRAASPHRQCMKFAVPSVSIRPTKPLSVWNGRSRRASGRNSVAEQDCRGEMDSMRVQNAHISSISISVRRRSSSSRQS